MGSNVRVVSGQTPQGIPIEVTDAEKAKKLFGEPPKSRLVFYIQALDPTTKFDCVCHQPPLPIAYLGKS